MRAEEFSVVALIYAVKMKELAHGAFRLRRNPHQFFERQLQRMLAIEESNRPSIPSGWWNFKPSWWLSLDDSVCNFLRNFLPMTGL
jgi:hypothetical protein